MVLPAKKSKLNGMNSRVNPGPKFRRRATGINLNDLAPPLLLEGEGVQGMRS